MKIHIYKILASCLVVLFSFTQILSAQEITEENYLKVDKEIWDKYEQDMNKLSECFQAYPEKKDSLNAVRKQVYELASMKNLEAAKKFASVPSGLRRLFMLRLDLPKDTVERILRDLPESMQESPYGKSIQFHLDSDQIEAGDRYYNFNAFDTDGNNFELSSLEGKNILLLYGGLSCMGKDGRKFLDKIYNETSRENFEIVVYCLSSNLENLKKVRNDYNCDYILVSDYLQDHTPMKILYGAQAMPTCFFIDKKGTVIMKEIGLNQEYVSELLKEN